MTDAVVPVLGATLAAQIAELEEALQTEQSRIEGSLTQVDQEIAKVVAPFRERKSQLSDASRLVQSEINNQKQQLVEQLEVLQSQCDHANRSL